MRKPKNADFLQIKPFRERMRLKQKELAKALGANQVTLGNWENGHRDPPFWVVKKLFEMGATVKELFGVEVEENIPAKSDFDKKVAEALMRMISPTHPNRTFAKN